MSALEKEVTNIPWWPDLAHIFKEKYITSDIFSIHKHFLNTAHLPILVLTSVTQHYTNTLLHRTAQQAEITHYWIFMLKSKKLLKSLAVWERGNRYMFSSWDNENEKKIWQEVKFHNGWPLLQKWHQLWGIVEYNVKKKRSLGWKAMIEKPGEVKPNKHKT